MSQIETHPKATSTSTNPENHSCCGGASTPESTTKSSNPADPAAVGRPNPSATKEKECCCGGAKSNPAGQKR